LKIFFVTNSLRKGGKERQVVELIHFLISQSNCEVVLWLREPEVSYELKDHEKLKIIAPEKRIPIHRISANLQKEIKTHQPDVIHVWQGLLGFFVAVRNLTSRRIPVVESSIRYSKKIKKTRPYYWLARISRKRSDIVVANSRAGLNSVPYLGKKNQKVVYNGMNLSRFNERPNGKRGSQKKKFTVGMVATFSKIKDQPLLIKAVSELLEQNLEIKCILVGDGPELEHCRNMIPKHQLSGFEFTGQVDDVEPLLEMFDIGILLSRKGHSEGLSNTIMEYMMAGLPVICTRTGGNPELIEEPVGGTLITHENKEALKTAILSYMADEKLRATAGEHNRNYGLSHFGVEKMGESYIQLYKSLKS